MGVNFGKNELKLTYLKSYKPVFKTKFFDNQTLINNTEFIYKNYLSVVNEAVQKGSNRHFWVKKILKQNYRKGDLPFDLQQAPNITHPLYNAPVDYQEDSNQWIILYNPARGVNFTKFLATYGKQSEKLTAEICFQLLSFVDQLNNFEVFHRTLSPECIWIHPSTLQVIVIDVSTCYFDSLICRENIPTNLTFSPPEMIREIMVQNRTCDCQSIGLMMQVLLFADSPYDPNITEAKNLRGEILNGNQRNISQFKLNLSACTKDFLLKNALHQDWKTRPTARELLQHDFIQEKAIKWKIDFKNNQNQQMENIINFRKQFIIPNIIGQSCNFLNRCKLVEFQIVIDDNKDGCIQKEEVFQLINQKLDDESQAMQKTDEIFSMFDIDGSNTIDFEEFSILAFSFGADLDYLEYFVVNLDTPSGNVHIDSVLEQMQLDAGNVAELQKIIYRNFPDFDGQLSLLDLIDNMLYNSEKRYKERKWQRRLKARHNPSEHDLRMAKAITEHHMQKEIINTIENKMHFNWDNWDQIYDIKLKYNISHDTQFDVDQYNKNRRMAISFLRKGLLQGVIQDQYKNNKIERMKTHVKSNLIEKLGAEDQEESDDLSQRNVTELENMDNESENESEKEEEVKVETTYDIYNEIKRSDIKDVVKFIESIIPKVQINEHQDVTLLQYDKTRKTIKNYVKELDSESIGDQKTREVETDSIGNYKILNIKDPELEDLKITLDVQE